MPMRRRISQAHRCTGCPRSQKNRWCEAIAHVRMQLETGAFEAAWAEGHAMTEAQAVASALCYLQAHFGL
jgi:hypothetical protein